MKNRLKIKPIFAVYHKHKDLALKRLSAHTESGVLVVQYWIFEAGRPQGPYDAEALVALPTFSAESRICLVGDDEWRPARDCTVIRRAIPREMLCRDDWKASRPHPMPPIRIARTGEYHVLSSVRQSVRVDVRRARPRRRRPPLAAPPPGRFRRAIRRLSRVAAMTGVILAPTVVMPPEGSPPVLPPRQASLRDVRSPPAAPPAQRSLMNKARRAPASSGRIAAAPATTSVRKPSASKDTVRSPRIDPKLSRRSPIR
jgi:hypothetical protein